MTTTVLPPTSIERPLRQTPSSSRVCTIIMIPTNRPRKPACAELVVHAMLQAYPLGSSIPRPGKRRIEWPDFPDEHARFLESNPNAMLLGLLFDRMMDAGKAWQGPLGLARRLGHLDPLRLSNMSEADLEAAIRGRPGEQALQRFPSQTARSIKACAHKLVRSYRGDASNIWAHDPGARVVRDRLLEFRGISQKLANVMTCLLTSTYGVPLSGWCDIDVAVDRHVCRVFLRTGLVDGAPGRPRHPANALVDSVVQAARRLHPAFPGGLDTPAFDIGQTWCRAGGAACLDGCPLLEVCPRNRTHWEIGAG